MTTYNNYSYNGRSKMQSFVLVWSILFALLAVMIKNSNIENNRTHPSVYEKYEKLSTSSFKANV